MPTEDTSIIKRKIISIIQEQGPSLPVQIASKTQVSPLFISAFLSELLSSQEIKTSNMRVGSSPLYLIPGQEPQLEKFAIYLKSKEKEAFILLKENQILKDSEQQPAIRVALRAIKDFAIPSQKNNELYWKYFTYQKEIEENNKEENNSSNNEPQKREEGQEIDEREKEKNKESIEQTSKKLQKKTQKRKRLQKKELKENQNLLILQKQMKNSLIK
jgi:hypothetical protein